MPCLTPERIAAAAVAARCNSNAERNGMIVGPETGCLGSSDDSDRNDPSGFRGQRTLELGKEGLPARPIFRERSSLVSSSTYSGLKAGTSSKRRDGWTRNLCCRARPRSFVWQNRLNRATQHPTG